MALATTVHGQITVGHADSVHLGTVLGTGGNGFYGRNYLKNLTQGQASDSILVANADGLVRLVKRSSLVPPLTLQGVTNLGNSTTNNIGIGGIALTGGTSAHWLTVNGSVYSGGIIYAEGNAAKAYQYVDTDHMLVNQATSGIGQKFLVNGSSSPAMILNTGGFVGMGTTIPDARLHVAGGATMYGNWKRTVVLEASYPVLAFQSTANGRYGGIGYDGGAGMAFWVNATSDDIPATALSALMIRYDGKVGIGYSVPAEKLSIAGNVLANQYKLSDLNTAPANASDTGTKGEVRITADYIYVCIATNTWVRTALSTW